MIWPFDDPRNVGVFTSKYVLEDGEPIFFVTHDIDDGAWQFHAQNHMETSDADIRFVALEEMYCHDASIGDLCDLPCGWQAWRQTPTSEWQRRRTPVGDMFYLAFDAVPTTEHSDFNVTGGAEIYCWIVAESIQSAEQVARGMLEESHWFIKELAEAFEVDEASFESDEMVSYYRQAEIDGEVFLIHSYLANQASIDDKS